ncbi:MAG: AbrB/MazE/SpoVT family DNA-binding domain-containing protein [Candidatus Dormibacteria bacterium]
MPHTHLSVTARVGPAGRLVIPASVRKRLGIEVGSQVVLTEAPNGDIVLTTPAQSLRRLQELVRERVPGGISLVDELLAERRAEAGSDVQG